MLAWIRVSVLKDRWQRTTKRGERADGLKEIAPLGADSQMPRMKGFSPCRSFPTAALTPVRGTNLERFPGWDNPGLWFITAVPGWRHTHYCVPSVTSMSMIIVTSSTNPLRQKAGDRRYLCREYLNCDGMVPSYHPLGHYLRLDGLGPCFRTELVLPTNVSIGRGIRRPRYYNRTLYPGVRAMHLLRLRCQRSIKWGAYGNNRKLCATQVFFPLLASPTLVHCGVPFEQGPWKLQRFSLQRGYIT